VKKPTWAGDWPIPRRVILPGCRIKVRVLNPEDRKALSDCYGVTIYSHEKDACAILIDGSLPLPVQRYVFIHELRHVINEYHDIMLEHYLPLVHPKSVQELLKP